MTDTFDSLRPMLETYLREQGIDPRKRFRCLNPEHFDHDPSMATIRNATRSTALPAAAIMTSLTCCK